MPSQSVLQALACQGIEQAQRSEARDGGKSTRVHATRSQAGTWPHPRRVVRKVAGAAQGGTPRVGMSDRAQTGAQGRSRHRSGARGPMEQDLKDHTRALQAERPFCHRFAAHQCRLFCQAAVSVFLDTWRREGCKTPSWACATMETIQWRVGTLGARGHALPDRITRALPSSCPVAPLLRRSLPLGACVRLSERAL